jgi:hypothetical protein
MSKKALVVGINNFTRPQWRLRGCINDTIEMQGILKAYFGFQPEDIRVLHDQDASNLGIRDGLAWLLSGYSGDGSDVRVFHFSSHGSQVPDQNQDEWECFDEVIVPHDHDWNAAFRDDELWEFFKPIPQNVNFTFIADCCHSGTMQKAAKVIEFYPRFLHPDADVMAEVEELRAARDDKLKAYQAAQMAQMLQGVPPEQWPEKMKEFLVLTEEQFKRQFVGVVPFERHFLLAGCEDQQTAADARIEGQWRGAFTWALSKAIKEANGDLSYLDLITRTGANLKDYDQRPQLECPTVLRDRKFLAPLEWPPSGSL